jgi:hypothetical protein
MMFDVDVSKMNMKMPSVKDTAAPIKITGFHLYNQSKQSEITVTGKSSQVSEVEKNEQSETYMKQVTIPMRHLPWAYIVILVILLCCLALFANQNATLCVIVLASPILFPVILLQIFFGKTWDRLFGVVGLTSLGPSLLIQISETKNTGFTILQILCVTSFHMFYITNAAGWKTRISTGIILFVCGTILVLVTVESLKIWLDVFTIIISFLTVLSAIISSYSKYGASSSQLLLQVTHN